VSIKKDMAMEVCLPSKVDTAVVMTNSTLRIVGSDTAKKNRENVETTIVKNYEGVTMTNDLKDVDSTHRLHRSRHAKCKYEYKNEAPNCLQTSR